MGIGWMKSVLQCKSKASDDVVHNHSSCRSLKDVVIIKTANPKLPLPFPRKLESGAAGWCFSSLPRGHPSRNVVEIIFHRSWGVKKFPGRVDTVLKIQNSTRTLNRFEEYRETVKCRWSSSHARCVADGNEMMRFYCLADEYEATRRACTFSGSGLAHENGGGGRRTGRAMMLVCRVIAGRVFNQLKFDSVNVNAETGYDSVGGGNGELLVFNTRAVLPCFLIIYHL